MISREIFDDFDILTLKRDIEHGILLKAKKPVRRSLAEKIGHTLPTDVKEVTLADGETKLNVMGYIPISTSIEGAPIDDVVYVIERIVNEG